MKKNYKVLIVIALAFMLTACAKAKASETDIQTMAVDTAMAYFTYDYESAEQWMSAVKNGNYYREFIQPEVIPVLAPYFSDHQVRSSAKLLATNVYYEKDLGDGNQITVWRIELNVNPVWPSDGPPSPFNSGEINGIPWTGENTTIVYAVATHIDNAWNIFLIPSNPIDDALPSLQTQD